MIEQNFRRELPEGYKQVFYLNAKSAKVGIIFTFVSLVVLVLVLLLAAAPMLLGAEPVYAIELEGMTALFALYGFVLIMLIYIVLHELVHGAVYKALTGEKMTFGISWSCAFCGVPNIYTYRRTSILSAAAPLVLFTALMLPIQIVLYFVHPMLYWMMAVLFGMHLGGCCGDGYLILLLLTKYKDPRVLVRDTGPEQYIYVPTEE